MKPVVNSWKYTEYRGTIFATQARVERCHTYHLSLAQRHELQVNGYASSSVVRLDVDVFR